MRVHFLVLISSHIYYLEKRRKERTDVRSCNISRTPVQQIMRRHNMCLGSFE
jgi:hypothetical protein